MNSRVASLLTALLFLAIPLAFMPAEAAVADATDCTVGVTPTNDDPLYDSFCEAMMGAKGASAPVTFAGDYDGDGRADAAKVSPPDAFDVFVQMDYFYTPPGHAGPFEAGDAMGDGYDLPVLGIMLLTPDSSDALDPGQYRITDHYLGETDHIGLYEAVDGLQYGQCLACFDQVNNRLATLAGPAVDAAAPTEGMLAPGPSGFVMDLDRSEDSIQESGLDPNDAESMIVFGLGSNTDLDPIYPDNFPVTFRHLHIKEVPDDINGALYATRVSNLDDDRSTDYQESPCMPSGTFSNPFYGAADCENFDGDAFDNFEETRDTIPDSILEATLEVVGVDSREAPFLPKFELTCSSPASGIVQSRVSGTGAFATVYVPNSDPLVEITADCGTEFNVPRLFEPTGSATSYDYRVVLDDPLAGGAKAASGFDTVTVEGNAKETVTVDAVCLSALPTCGFNGNQAEATLGTTHTVAGITYDPNGFPTTDPNRDEDDLFTVQYWVTHDSAEDEQDQFLRCIRVEGRPFPNANSNGNFPNADDEFPDGCRGAFADKTPATGVYKVGSHSQGSVTATRNYSPAQALGDKFVDFLLDSGGREATPTNTNVYTLPVPAELNAHPRFIEAAGANTPTEAGNPAPDLTVPVVFRAVIYDAGAAGRARGVGELIAADGLTVNVTYTTTDPTSGGADEFKAVAMALGPRCTSHAVNNPANGAEVYRQYHLKNAQTCPDGEGAAKNAYTDGNTGNGEFFKGTATVPSGTQIWYAFTVEDAAGVSVRSPANGFIPFTAGQTVPEVPVPNPFEVLGNPNCKWGPFAPGYEPVEDNMPNTDLEADEDDCGSINDAAPAGLPGDSNDPWDTNGDGITAGQANGQNDVVESFVAHYNPDETAHADASDRFSGVSPNGYTLHVHTELNLAPRDRDTATLRFGNVAGTDLEEVIVAEFDQTVICVAFVDGTPALFSNVAYSVGLTSYSEGPGAYKSDPESPCGHPSTEQEVNDLASAFGDPFWGLDVMGLIYLTDPGAAWFVVEDDNDDGVPERIKVRIPSADCLDGDGCSPDPNGYTVIDLASPLDPVSGVVDEAQDALEGVLGDCLTTGIEPCIPPACDDELSNVPCLPAIGPDAVIGALCSIDSTLPVCEDPCDADPQPEGCDDEEPPAGGCGPEAPQECMDPGALTDMLCGAGIPVPGECGEDPGLGPPPCDGPDDPDDVVILCTTPPGQVSGPAGLPFGIHFAVYNPATGERMMYGNL